MPPTRPPELSRYSITALLFAVWSVPGLLCAIQIYAEAVVQDGLPITGGDILLYSLPVWWIWVPMSVGVAKMARTYDFAPGHRLRSSIAHGIAVMTAVAIHLAFYALWMGWTAPYPTEPTFFARLTDLLDELWIQLNVFLYALVAGLTTALDTHTAFRTEHSRAEQLKQQLTEARLHALRSQLRPHFLFNTLGALQTLVLRHDDHTAATMVSRLSEYLRATLDDDVADAVPLDDEVAFTHQYLAIEQCRFSDRLTVTYDIHPDVREALVPNMILQPLVENAVQHGVSQTSAPCLIRVSAKGSPEEDGSLKKVRISVENRLDQKPDLSSSDYASPNGVPSKGKRDRKTSANAERANGHGLSITRRRLHERYGPEATLSTRPIKPWGFRVTMILPYDSSANDCLENDRLENDATLPTTPARSHADAVAQSQPLC